MVGVPAEICLIDSRVTPLISNFISITIRMHILMDVEIRNSNYTSVFTSLSDLYSIKHLASWSGQLVGFAPQVIP